ncbi:MAG TPA: metallophosphoesterase [Spirochaetota bacterium]|nr:metallophosphoesterase [Spirochaetota bacterium]
MKTNFFYLLLLTTFFSCSTELIINDNVEPSETLIIWAHSDIQPRYLWEKYHYEYAIDDVRSLPFVPDMAIVAGDINHRQSSDMYWNWIKDLRKKTGITYWFEIAGNHDNHDIETYKRQSGKPLHYTVRCGNLLFIFLSDETKKANTIISDDVFEWWKNIVINNQDSIIITVTHAPLFQSQLVSTLNWTMIIKDSDRFWDVIKDYTVDVWISAHDHLPSMIPIKYNTPDNCKTLFLDVSSIHKVRFSPIESWFLIFQNGSSSLQCAARSHEKKLFYSSSFTYELSKKVFYKRNPPTIDKKYQ